MATKTITITEEAYERLKTEKEDGESFSDVVNRLTGKTSLLKLAGLLSDEEADELERNIEEMRKRSRERTDRVARELR